MIKYAARLALLLVALLTACGMLPFRRADVEAIVFWSGDLPPGWAVGQRYESMVGDPDPAPLLREPRTGLLGASVRFTMLSKYFTKPAPRSWLSERLG